MKTKFILPVIAIVIIAVSAFFIYISYITNPPLQHHDEVKAPTPPDRSGIQGIRWEWNDYSYDVNEEISFTVSRHAESCGDVFDARIMTPDWSEVLWEESVRGRCEIETDYDELTKNGDYSVLVTADFPSETPIKIEMEGKYLLRVESHETQPRALEGYFLVKNKKDDSAAAIENLTKTILSSTSHSDKRQAIQKAVSQDGLGEFSRIAISNLKKEYDAGEEITFDLTIFGYRNWCLLPTLYLYYEGYDKPIYESSIIHSCPPPWETSEPYIGYWDASDFRDFPVCRYEGTHTIFGESFEFGSTPVGQYYCHGKEEFVPPTIHQIIIQNGATNPHIKANFEPDKINAAEGDTIKFVNQDEAEFWIIAESQSDSSDGHISIHLDPHEIKEVKRIKRGDYLVSVEIDQKSIPWMNATIHVK